MYSARFREELRSLPSTFGVMARDVTKFMHPSIHPYHALPRHTLPYHTMLLHYNTLLHIATFAFHSITLHYIAALHHGIHHLGGSWCGWFLHSHMLRSDLDIPHQEQDRSLQKIRNRIDFYFMCLFPNSDQNTTMRLGYNWSFLTNFLQTLGLISDQDWSTSMLRKCHKWQDQLHPPKKERGKLFSLCCVILHQKTKAEKGAWATQRESDVLKRSCHTDDPSSLKSKVLKHHDSMSVHIEASNASYYSKVRDTIFYHLIILSSVCTLQQYQTWITTMLLECENLCKKQFLIFNPM